MAHKGRQFEHKADGNADPIWKLVKRLGGSVAKLTNVGDGCPDGLIGFGGRVNYLAEIKQPGRDLSDGQEKFVRRWRGLKPVVLRTGEDVVRLLLQTPAQPVVFGGRDRFRYEVFRVDTVTGERTLIETDITKGGRG